MTTDKPRPSRARRAARMTGDDRERAILASFEAQLATRSLHAISIDDIARGAGISRPTFYFYFPSKDAVLLSLLDRMVDQARSERDAALASAGSDPARAWRAAIAAFHSTFRTHRAVSVAAADARATNPEVRALWERVMSGLVDETAAAIEGERARGAAPPGAPARDLAVALNLMNERVLHTSLADHAPTIADDRVVDVLLTIWLAAIYGGAAPRSP